MRGILNIRMLSVRAALMAVLAAGLVLPGAQAQSAKQNQESDNNASGSSKAQASSAGSKVAEEETAPANKQHAGGPQEGIKIHGHWVIDVRDPDGKLVTHREFENAYQPSSFLSLILSRQNSVGLWQVQLGGGDFVYTLAEFLANRCGPPLCFPSLIVSANGGGGVVLNGSFNLTSGINQNLSSVSSLVGACESNVAPSNPCQTDAPVLLTATNFSPVVVVPGQLVQVTVTITFS